MRLRPSYLSNGSSVGSSLLFYLISGFHLPDHTVTGIAPTRQRNSVVHDATSSLKRCKGTYRRVSARWFQVHVLFGKTSGQGCGLHTRGTVITRPLWWSPVTTSAKLNCPDVLVARVVVLERLNSSTKWGTGDLVSKRPWEFTSIGPTRALLGVTALAGRHHTLGTLQF